jgi:ribosomal protein L9
MKKEITIQAVQKGATEVLWSKLYIALAVTGVCIILAYSIGLNPVKHHWAAIPLFIVTFTLVFSKLIARIVVKNNKKAQIRYVVEAIDGYKHSAMFFRNLGKQYEQKLIQSAESMFERNEQDLDTKMSDLEVFEKNIRAEYDSFLQRAGNAAMKALKEVPEDEIKQMIRDQYKEYADKHLLSLEKILRHLGENRGMISNDFEQEVEVILNAREKLAAQYFADMEKVAIEYETQAQEWEYFLKNNYH